VAGHDNSKHRRGRGANGAAAGKKRGARRRRAAQEKPAAAGLYAAASVLAPLLCTCSVLQTYRTIIVYTAKPGDSHCRQYKCSTEGLRRLDATRSCNRNATACAQRGQHNGCLCSPRRPVGTPVQRRRGRGKRDGRRRHEGAAASGVRQLGGLPRRRRVPQRLCGVAVVDPSVLEGNEVQAGGGGQGWRVARWEWVVGEVQALEAAQIRPSGQRLQLSA
jgi:hypothetical protein